MKKVSRYSAVLLAAIMLFAGCGEAAQPSQQTTPGNTAAAGEQQISVCSEEMLQDFSSWEDGEYYSIQLNGDSVISNASSIETSSAKITITEAGTYLVTGKLDDAQIVVNVPGDGVVRLILSDVTLHYSRGAAINVQSAEMTVLLLPEGTSSTITDGETYLLSSTETEPDAAIYSKDDLVLTGSGSLTVTGNYQNAITGKDDVAVTGGNYTLTAVNNGIKGKDSVVITAGNLTITAGNDAIKSTNSTNSNKGNILISGGTLNLISECDGIQAENTVYMTDGSLTVSSGGGSANASTGSTAESWGHWGDKTYFSSTSTDAVASATTASEETPSAKGIKAAKDIQISGGVLTLDTSDDAIHSNISCTISGGTLKITSGDDGIHADKTLCISGGTVTVERSYEGLEGAQITISDGVINVTSSDDGINAAGGSDASGANRVGAGSFSQSGNYLITIAGGTLHINAGGDGIDSNGSILVTGGKVTVDGPSDNGNGAIDYGTESGGTCSITGGTVIAVGGSGMAETFDSNSTQCVFCQNISGTAGSTVTVKSSDGTVLMKYTAAKSFSNVVFSSPDLVQGETYTLSSGSNSVTVTLTSVSTGGGMGMGGMGGGTKPNMQGAMDGTRPERTQASQGDIPFEATSGATPPGAGQVVPGSNAA